MPGRRRPWCRRHCRARRAHAAPRPAFAGYRCALVRCGSGWCSMSACGALRSFVDWLGFRRADSGGCRSPAVPLCSGPRSRGTSRSAPPTEASTPPLVSSVPGDLEWSRRTGAPPPPCASARCLRAGTPSLVAGCAVRVRGRRDHSRWGRFERTAHGLSGSWWWSAAGTPGAWTGERAPGPRTT